MAAQTPDLLRQVISATGEKLWTANYVWDPNALDWVAMTQPGSSAGGGGAATIADGADVTQGAKADAAWDGSALAPTAQSILKYLGAKIEAVRALLAGTLTISAASLPLPTGAATSAAQASGNTSVASIDTKTPALGQALSAASVPVVLPAAQVTTLTPPAAITGFALEAGHLAAIDTHLDVALSTRLKPADTLAGVTTVAAVTSITNAVTVNDLANAPATAKGTQGAKGVPTQDLKDAGRTYVVITIDAVAGITVEALATLAINKGGTASSATSYTVTAGKTLRLLFFGSSVKNTSTVATNSRARVRAAAAVLATSPIVAANECGTAAAVALCSATDDSPFPEGIEIAGGQQIGISHIESATTSTVSCCLVGYEY